MKTTKDQREKILRNTANPDELWTIDGKLPLSDLIDDITELERKLAICVGALEFYGCKEAYYVNGAAHMQNHIADSDLEEFNEHRAYFNEGKYKCGGKRAREALASIQAEGGGE